MRKANDAPVCARCAEAGHSCCKLRPGEEDLCFPVSEIERQRIVEFGPKKGGLTGARNSKAFLDRMMRLFPGDRAHIDRLFPPRGEHLRLATLPDGRCSFLGPSGCVLPREARPYHCRLFPFWVSAGAVTAISVKGCQACAEGRTASAMLPLLAMNRALVRELHGRMRLAWGMAPGGEESGLRMAEVENDA